MASVAIRNSLQIILMLGLRLPEIAGGSDLGHHLAGPQAGRLDVGDRVLGDLALLVARGEDLRAIVGPDVPALAIIGRRVMDLEEELEDVAVGDPLGIEENSTASAWDGCHTSGSVSRRRCSRRAWR